VPDSSAERPANADVIAGVAAGVLLAGVIGLHVVEPRLGVTWSYAHLGRDGWRVALAIVAAVALPVLGARVWRTPILDAPFAPKLGVRMIAAGGAFVVAMAAIGAAAPAPASNYDSVAMLEALAGLREPPPRWMLGSEILELLVRPFRGLDAFAFKRSVAGIDSALAAVGLLGLACVAREIARTRGEAAVVALLAASAFGTLQIAVGYIDIYPLALGIIGAYLAFAAFELRRGSGLYACAALAATAPFVYIGLTWMVPSLLVVGFFAGRRDGGARRVALGAVVAVAAAGLATVPRYGLPFQWLAFLDELNATIAAHLGLQPTSSLLPLDYLLSWRRVEEVIHSMLLVDPVGWVLLATCGAAVLVRWLPRATPNAHADRSCDPLAVFLLSVALPGVVYGIAMDPIYGAYLDWDLWAVGAPPVSLLAAWSLVAWGRRRRAWMGTIAGLALACALTHALARLHALPLEAERHLRETPHHYLREAASAAPRPTGSQPAGR